MAVCYVALDELSPCDPYSFAVAAARALSEFDGVDLPAMREVEDRRFDRRMGALADLHGHAEIGSVAAGATVAGISVGGDLVINAPAGDHDLALQERLRDEATRGLSARSARAGEARSVVLLVDAFEASARTSPTGSTACCASASKPPTSSCWCWRGSGSDRDVEADARRALQRDVVRSVDALSSWEPDHVRAVLDAHGVQRYDEPTSTTSCSKLADGRPIGLTVASIVQFLREGGER